MLFCFTTNFTTVTPTAAVPNTLIKILAAASHQVKVKGLRLGQQGTDGTKQPVTFKIARQSNDGTETGAVVGYKLNDSDGDSIAATAKYLYTAEPTTGNVLYVASLHVQGTLVEHFPDPIIIGAGDCIGFIVTPAAGVAVPTTLTVFCEE